MFGIDGLGFGLEGFGFGVQGLGLRILYGYKGTTCSMDLYGIIYAIEFYREYILYRAIVPLK